MNRKIKDRLSKGKKFTSYASKLVSTQGIPLTTQDAAQLMLALLCWVSSRPIESLTSSVRMLIDCHVKGDFNAGQLDALDRLHLVLTALPIARMYPDDEFISSSDELCVR